jgi:acetyl-CoA synthetase
MITIIGTVSDDDVVEEADAHQAAGYRIGPFEVESALMTHPAVVECAITGVPDDIRGMVVKATVVLGKEWKDKAGEDLIKELQQHVKKETAPSTYHRVCRRIAKDYQR